MKEFNNEQENLWLGKFGDDYINRNQSAKLYSSNLHFFSKILNLIQNVNSITEFGCNIGINLKALKNLSPKVILNGIEINAKAVEILKMNLPDIDVEVASIIKPIKKTADLIFTKGVLIHIHPSDLDNVYHNLYTNSRKYILIAEYYNPLPIEINYRGNKNKLFKRDFAGDLLDRFGDLQLVEYGFLYHRDPKFPFDDLSWFLLKKS